MSNLFFILLLLIFSLFINLQALTLPADISALQAFKAAIKPTTIPSWSCLGSWNFTFDPCSLPHRTHFICGITCNSDSTRITSIVLDPVGYSGTLSPLISTLTQITHIDLSENSFYGPIPSSISSLSNLETLTLRFNTFSGTLPPSLTSLKTLKSLDISHNTITGTLPNTFNSLSSLRSMDLSFNKFTGSLPKLPPNIAELAIKANSLSGFLSESSFQGLNHLEVVELSANFFTGSLKGWFFLLPSLQQVNLSNNSLTSVEIWKPTNPRSDLVAVDLGFNKLEGFLPVNFKKFPILSSLSLRYNKFRGPIPYGNKLSLRRLFLDGNFLNGKVPSRFFSNGSSSSGSISGSFADNCLESCPSSSQLCLPSQKPISVCKQAYGRRPRA
ncbi:Leucine-rich repeat [Macleaya cordata]|uniref:Leucine-rich repeat n=1 Tax=Macleaya cordata TaxID=56857 RepID=A0A200QZK3_MACCD|nr:Leucine-rich repeat [Macleaya cordata]